MYLVSVGSLTQVANLMDFDELEHGVNVPQERDIGPMCYRSSGSICSEMFSL